MKTRRFLVLLLFFVLGAVVAGCGVPVGVQRVGVEQAYHEINANVLNQGVLSTASLEVLHRRDLKGRFDEAPTEVLERLHKEACRDKNRELLFALSELSHFTAKQFFSREYYLTSAIYAYLYLFGDGNVDPLNPYDRRFRVASDLYNIGLAKAIEVAQDPEVEGSSKITPKNGTRELPMGQIEVEVSRPGFPWGKEQFAWFLPADAFEVHGLSVRTRDPGLGVPLIAIQPPPKDGKQRSGYLPPHIKIPATAFVRIKGGVCEMGSENLSASVELYSPFDVAEVQVGNRKVPLETDLTAPLAYSLEDSILWEFELGGFFSGGQTLLKTGLYMVQPYQREKIPVVFVHGTASSPARWAEMFNTLQGDKDIRGRYQFWFFIYTTGNPIGYSAGLLRESLEKVVNSLDPNGDDQALKQMVVIGHSQGGLLTKMMVIESGDKFLDNLGIKSVEELGLKGDESEIIRRSLIFEPLPFVRRVVFIATPQRGSFIAGNWIGKLSSKLVSMPTNIVKLTTDLFATIVIPPWLKGKIPSSVDNMSPGHPFIKTLGSIPVTPDVKQHSIIPVEGEGNPEKGNDGVVEYASAHIEDADSELVVRSGHSVQSNPLAIGEVRRILLEHKREFLKLQK
jgi:pimeloyl-ACP methyl ester carboxylesterase